MILATRSLLVFALVLLAPPLAFADTTTPPTEAAKAPEAAKATSSAGLGAGMSMGFAVVGAGIGIGLIGFAALSGIARQPEQAGKIQGAMYVLAALVEGLAIIALGLSFVIALK